LVLGLGVSVSFATFFFLFLCFDLRTKWDVLVVDTQECLRARCLFWDFWSGTLVEASLLDIEASWSPLVLGSA
jgi:hypothetical protein